jgi:hypothetical protein
MAREKHNVSTSIALARMAESARGIPHTRGLRRSGTHLAACMPALATREVEVAASAFLPRPVPARHAFATQRAASPATPADELALLAGFAACSALPTALAVEALAAAAPASKAVRAATLALTASAVVASAAPLPAELSLPADVTVFAALRAPS